MSDLRWKFAVLVFLTIPIYGGWFVMKHSLIMNNEIALDLSELPDNVNDEIQLIKLSGFSSEQSRIFDTVNHEFVVVKSTNSANEETPVFALLERRKTEPSNLAGDISDGVVSGLISANCRISNEHAFELGLEVPEGLDSILVVKVDKEYLTSTCGITLAYLVIGSIVLWVVYSKLDDAKFKQQAVQTKTKSMVALQLQIARHENYRNIG